MSSYMTEMLMRGRIDDLRREADGERLAREARVGTPTQRRGRDGLMITIVRRTGRLSAVILRTPDAREHDRHGAAL
jgi:hypothetical protein